MMKKILIILTSILLIQSTYAQIKYDNGGIKDNSTQIGEFVVQGNKWTNSRFITYFFQNTTNDIIPQANARAAVRQAFATWQAQTRLYFIEVCSAATADIIILWGDGNHGDNFPFDGVNGVLAHAYFPPPNSGTLAGDMHFDDGEAWSEFAQIGGFQPIDLQTVALHEIGHSLGLNHTPVANSVMEAFYNGSRRVLGTDDIAGIRSIYGSPIEIINGLSSFCSTTNLSLNETLPSWISCQWTSNIPAITFTNIATNGSNVTVNSGGFQGNATITATITSGCGSIQFTKLVLIGGPTPITNIATSYTKLKCNVLKYVYTVVGATGATNFKWYYRNITQGTGFLLYKNTSLNWANSPINDASCDQIEIRVDASNSCSNIPVQFQFNSDACPSFVDGSCTLGRSLLATQSQSSYNIELKLVDEVNLIPRNTHTRKIVQVKIIDKMGQVHKIINGNKLMIMTIDISELPNDIYTILVSDGKEWMSKQISKN